MMADGISEVICEMDEKFWRSGDEGFQSSVTPT
jgi:hypothetical protein